MSVKPIIFSDPMVRAIRDDRKTVTRRLTNLKDQSVVKCGPKTMAALGHPIVAASSPYASGDLLWVRETWTAWSPTMGTMPEIYYRADNRLNPENKNFFAVKWRPAIYMPKSIARLFLRVTDVCPVRLQDITDDDAEREGFSEEAALKDEELDTKGSIYGGMFKPRYVFAVYWDYLRKPADRVKYGWDANPWVWRIEFRRADKPENWPKV